MDVLKLIEGRTLPELIALGEAWHLRLERLRKVREAAPGEQIDRLVIAMTWRVAELSRSYVTMAAGAKLVLPPKDVPDQAWLIPRPNHFPVGVEGERPEKWGEA